ncbi:MAG: cell division protein FtsA [Bdellovibrionales bacterium]|nr:cell division protein FtsA [Bdellovibrionales bacterium]
MRKKSQIISGLDIGTSFVRVAIAEKGETGNLSLLGIGEAPSRGLRKGVVINIDATVQAIGEALDQAQTMAGTTVGQVIASMSGSHLRGFSSNGIVGIRGKEVSLYDVEKVIEAAKAVAIPVDREVLHVLPQEFIIDDQDGIREPLGMAGVRLEARVHIVTGAIASAQNVVKCANRSGLAVKDIVASTLSSGAALITPEEQELGICLIDIGGGTTDLCVYHGGTVRHTAVISVGGGHVTNDIAAGLRTPIASAEKVKCEFGSAVVDSRTARQSIEVVSTGGRPPRELSRLVLSEIIEPRLSEIFELVKSELRSAEVEEFIASGIVLTGGSANLQGITTLAERAFDLPVRVGIPEGLGSLRDLTAHPEYSTVIGLVLHGARAVSVRPFKEKKNFVLRTVGRINDWFVENF